MVLVAEQLTKIKDRALDRITPRLAQGALQAMALALRVNPALKHLLHTRHPSGVEAAFKARFVFTTFDGDMAVHAVFDGRRMRVGSGTLQAPDVTVRVRTPAHLRALFRPDADIFNMLLNNDLFVEGNLIYVARFNHVAKAVTLGGKALPPRANGVGPARWQDLAAPPVGQPCPERPVDEVTHLEDPYLAHWSLDDFPRLKRLLWVHRTLPPAICTERPRLITEFKLTAGPRPTRRGESARYTARALHHIMTRRQAIIHDDDLLAGTTTSRRIGVMIYPETIGTTIWPELLTMQARELNPYRISAEDVRILGEEVFPFWADDNVREWARSHFDNPRELQLDERFVLYFLWKNYAVSHTIADMPGVLARGLLDIQAEARERERQADDAERRAFYQALQLAASAVLDYARRIGSQAAALAASLGDDEASTARREELRELSRICEKVPAHPAETLTEAVQAIWLLFLSLHQENTNAGLSLGRLDRWLEPYFQRDLAGVTDPDEKRRRIHRAVELAGALMLKCTDHLPLVADLGNRLFGGSSSAQVITLGGTTPEGGSAVSDMTWIFLKATEMLRLRDPNVNARYAPGVNSEAYLQRICEVNLLTRATPSIHNDDAVFKALRRQGIPEAHARDWSATGCVEPTVCGRHMGHTNCMMFNLVAPLEMALADGHHPIMGEQVGPHTGDPRTFGSYAEFWKAYTTQLAWLLDRAIDGNNLLGRTHQAIKPTPLLSALMRGPLEKGLDVIDGGAEYNSSGTALVALTDVVDSLACIKRLVYDQHRFSFDTLQKAVFADFVGYEEVHRQILRQVPRFGSDHSLPGEIASEIVDFIDDHLSRRQNYRGGAYLAGYWSMSNHVAFGLLSGALPSGRRRGQPFTPGLTPSPLTGAPLTEQIRTVAGLDPLKLPNNIAFNVKLVPGAQDDHRSVIQRMTAYVQTYCDLGGMQIQFNVVSTDTLRHAIKNPDDYRDLLVRISGYNAYFVELNRDMQGELIDRMEHSLG